MEKSASLQEAFAVEFGKGDLQRITVKHPTSFATLEVYTFGANVTSYRVPDGTGQLKEILFVSENAAFNGKEPITGGIPIVFPQFCYGGLGEPKFSADHTRVPFHGIARLQDWKVEEMTLVDGVNPKLVLTLKWSQQTIELWPYHFHLRYEILLKEDNSLEMSLDIANLGQPFEFQALLHPYFRVEHIAKASVSQLKGANFVDKVGNFAAGKEDRQEVVIEGATDCVYLDAPDQLEVKTGSTAGIRITKKALRLKGMTVSENDPHHAPPPSHEAQHIPTNLTIWNPWIEDCRRSADLDTEDYQKFVCVEPGLIAEVVTLPPGDTIVLSQTIHPAP